MKNLYIIISFIALAGCTTVQTVVENSNDDIIVYVLPLEVENILKAHVSGLKNKDLYLELAQENDNFTIFVSESDIFWKTRTNRKVVVDKKLYPLIFDTDAFFGSAESKGIILERLKTESKEKPFTRKALNPIYDNVFKVEFKKNGKVLYKGRSW
ncbi:hypothetical protein [Aquimarina longa]|uniref:hypothetical protein n=1 Tax=Aquimarina longa TaxID=1080221 RepID=UPI000781954E|nr:hypothetical protein [Aquimarina longa]